jgi:Na+/H+ antiporter NhaA
LLIGLEVKRELIQGSLASRRQAVFPVIAALGGMIVPALVYLAFNARILSPERVGDPGGDGYCLCPRRAGAVR